MRKVVIEFIKLYQRTLSPDHGWFRVAHPNGFCRYYPSCSSYAVEAVEKHGSMRGLLKSLWRIARCNPWSKGGIDRP